MTRGSTRLTRTSFDTSSTLYKHIALLNNVRNFVSAKSSAYLGYQTQVVSYAETEIQLRKDVVRTVLSNQGQNAATWTLGTKGMGFTSGNTVVNVIDCSTYTADGNGEVAVKMVQALPAVLLETGSLGGSNICGY